MNKRHDTDHSDAGQAKALQLLAELGQATLTPHLGGEAAIDAISRELKALVSSGAVSGDHVAILARPFLPTVAASLQTLASDPDPAVRADAQAMLGLEKVRAMVDRADRTKSERAC